jgi:hypothetical protein
MMRAEGGLGAIAGQTTSATLLPALLRQLQEFLLSRPATIQSFAGISNPFFTHTLTTSGN